MKRLSPSSQLILASCLAVGGLLLLFWGMLLPPCGAIDGSVLLAYGELSTFVAALFGD